MSLPNVIHAPRRSYVQRVATRSKLRRHCRQASGEDLVKSLVHVALYGYGLSVWQWTGHTSPVEGHSSISLHYAKFGDGTGKAADAYGAERAMRGFADFINSVGRVTEGIHNPNLSMWHGEPVASPHWGAVTWREHVNHVHFGSV